MFGAVQVVIWSRTSAFRIWIVEVWENMRNCKSVVLVECIFGTNWMIAYDERLRVRVGGMVKVYVR